MKKILGLILCLCLFVSGCVTTSSLSSRIDSLPYRCTIDEAKEQLGKLRKQERISYNITRLTFGRNKRKEGGQQWLYFRDGILVRTSNPWYFSTELEDYYALGLITKDEYEWRDRQRTERAKAIMQMIPPPSYQPSKRKTYQKQQPQVIPQSPSYDIYLDGHHRGSVTDGEIYLDGTHRGTIRER